MKVHPEGSPVIWRAGLPAEIKINDQGYMAFANRGLHASEVVLVQKWCRENVGHEPLDFMMIGNTCVFFEREKDAFTFMMVFGGASITQD